MTGDVMAVAQRIRQCPLSHSQSHGWHTALDVCCYGYNTADAAALTVAGSKHHYYNCHPHRVGLHVGTVRANASLKLQASNGPQRQAARWTIAVAASKPSGKIVNYTFRYRPNTCVTPTRIESSHDRCDVHVA